MHDYPFHLARAEALAALMGQVDRGTVYRLGSFLLPNEAMDVVTLALTAVLPVEVAGRVFLGLVQALLLGGVVALHRAQPGGVERQGRPAGGLEPWFQRIVVGPEAEEAMGGGVSGIQLLVAEGPAARVGRVWRAQVMRLQLAAPAGPVVGGAAEVAQAGGVGVPLGHAADLALVERLGRLLQLQPAGFEQHAS